MVKSPTWSIPFNVGLQITARPYRLVIICQELGKIARLPEPEGVGYTRAGVSEERQRCHWTRREEEVSYDTGDPS
jgi:hypothetical protein